MYTAIVTLKSISPMSQSKHYDIPKLNKESSDAYEKRTWAERLHFTDDGEVFVPPMALKNALSEGAKRTNKTVPGKGKSTYTKHFESGVMVMEPMMLGIKKDDVKGEWLFVPSDGIRGSGKRVLKCFPVIPEWEGEAEFIVLDETITKEVFEEILAETGKFTGLGRFRPSKNGYYGRFAIEKIQYKKGE